MSVIIFLLSLTKKPKEPKRKNLAWLVKNQTNCNPSLPFSNQFQKKSQSSKCRWSSGIFANSFQ
ncbi:hypothetical protein DSM25_12855 [Enterococcus faecalis]|nr:hypothetical protein [Enterococcus faecalis]PQB41663.1 hypothetical protein CUM82_04475 [Enterococcus faecalis]PQC86985.1 hypothetical protein CUN42_10080 [Enterococcus faecalis]PQE71299.1 hypothetical protein CUT01_05770 [Enterococcus faecalis]PQF02904.1 hypothetical protein CUT03_11855 [Enterococcus faecalis]